MAKTLKEYLEGYDHFVKEDEGIDEPTKSKKVEVDYDEIEKTLNDLIEKFTAVENIPHPGELSTEIKILKTFGDKIAYLKKYDKSGEWEE